MSTLERGFKSWSERVAVGVRRDLGLEPESPLPPEDLARYLDVILWTPRQVPDLPPEVLEQLLERDPWGWSAVTQEVDGCAVVIYNPRHSSGRRAVDIMHELAHLLLDHEPGTVILSHDGSIVMRTYNAKQEEEASWLAGCLLLPRVALLKVTRGGMSPAQIADHFGVSEPLATFRIRICGVEAQLRAMAGRSRRSRSAGRS